MVVLFKSIGIQRKTPPGNTSDVPGTLTDKIRFALQRGKCRKAAGKIGIVKMHDVEVHRGLVRLFPSSFPNKYLKNSI